MKKFIFGFLALILFATPAFAAAELGKPAPDFSTTDIKGNSFKLSNNKGKIIVLEWNNPECPFVHKHYDSDNMQTTQKTATSEGALWITINSGAPGKQGHVSAAEAADIMTKAGGNPTQEILDEKGEIGKLYGAQTTPHMFVIDKEGNIAYMGAIDDNPSPAPETLKGAKNYVLAAIDDLVANRPVETPVTQPYGCSVKYGD